MEFFILSFKLRYKKGYILWFTNDVDGVLTDSNGRIATFPSRDSALMAATAQNLPMSPSPSESIDMGWITESTCTTENIDCVRTLNAWKFFIDVAASIPEKAADFSKTNNNLSMVYDKLFWGNNLPAVTPPGEYYEPVWSKKEADEIQAILEIGLGLFTCNCA